MKYKKYKHVLLSCLILVAIGLFIYIIYKNTSKNKSRKIINTHWHGRFGNRMFTYAFGCCYAKKYNCTYYYLSEWEGNKLFKSNSYSEPLYNLDKEFYNNLIEAGGDNDKVKNAINKYNNKTKDNLEFVYMDETSLGKTNIAYNDFNIMYDLFEVYDRSFLINEIFQFNQNVKNTEIYKNLQNVKNKYFAAHIRMGDICEANFKGAHVCIGDKIKNKIPEINKDNLPEIIVSENNDVRKSKIDGFNLEYYNNKSKGHSWKQPEGEQFVDEIIFDFLPDFLTLIHSKVILRTNSSFSYWGAFLNINKNKNNIYSPIANENKDETLKHQNDIEIVNNNRPHFMGTQFKDININ